MEYTKLGTIIGNFSLDGTLKVMSTTNLKEERYQPGKKVFLFDPSSKTCEDHVVEAFRTAGQLDFVKLNNINNPEDALAKKKCDILADKSDVKLDKDQYFFSDLEQCEVYDGKNILLGKVIRVEEFPAQLTLRVKRKSEPDFFVPYVKEFIKNVDIENHKITINVIEGMLWE